MADASASSMPDIQQKLFTSNSEATDETSAIASSSDHATTTEPDELTTEEISISSHDPLDSNTDRANCDKQQTAYVVSESVDTSDDDSDKSSVTDLQLSPSTHDADKWTKLPTTPKVPWREGGIWHLRSNVHINHERHEYASGSDGGPQFYPIRTDSDSDSSTSVREYQTHSDEFQDGGSEIGMGTWREILHIDLNETDRERAHGPPEEPLYPQGMLVETECYVCFEETELRQRLCCNFPVCDSCLESYLIVQVLSANVNIECLNINCNSYIHRSEISARLPHRYKMNFYKFLIDANFDPTVKTCPRCSNGLQVEKTMLKKRKVIKNGLPVACKKCGLEWCFTCHAPLHKGLTCKEFRKGDILLKDWAREFHYGQLNAQQCPKCKIFIQRSLGCDHMTCTRCNTNFCYRCGEHYRGIKLLGNHFSRYSPFGCRYNFMPDAPHLRRLIRGAVLGGKLLGGLALSGFVVAAGACLLGISVIALPAWGGYKLHKRRRFRQRLRANRKYAKQNMALRNLQQKKAADLSVPSFPNQAVDSSDSIADDSSDEMRDRIVVGLELPDSQRVEVLVHQTISSSSDQEEGGACGGTQEVVTDSVVIVTDVQEVANENGYPTLVTNVYARSKDATDKTTSTPNSSDSSDKSDNESDSDDAQSHSNFRKTKEHSSSVKCNFTSSTEECIPNRDEKTSTECEANCCDEKDTGHTSVAVKQSACDDQRNIQSKHHQATERKEKEVSQSQGKRTEENDPNTTKEKKDKAGENTEKGDKKQTESVSCTEMKEKDKLTESQEKSDKRPDKGKDSSTYKPADQKDSEELSKESTNGCFGNIFSKKITVIQIGGRRNTDSQPDGQKPTNISFKSSTWEKSRDKSSGHKPKTSMDIQDLSHFKEKLPLQTSDLSVKPTYDKGVLLQDYLVLSPPGDFGSNHVKDLGPERVQEGDGLSVVSASSVEDVNSEKEAERSGEGGSCCCLSPSDSFRGSNLSCDIVTYL